MLSDPAGDALNVGQFLDLIYQDQEGHIYVACKVPGSDTEFTKHFYSWPKERNEAITFILAQREKYEVYYGPAIYKKPSGQKKDVLSSRVVWVEFDGNPPDDFEGIPSPSIRIRSSTEDHEHWYWILSEAVQPYELERINRGLTYFLHADTSGWDANQILRPPTTTNHKRTRTVELLEISDAVILPNAFDALPEPPPPVEIPIPSSIPDVTDVIAKHKLPEQMWRLFRKGVEEGKRGMGLMSLGYYAAELGMDNEEIFAILLNADQRWGKFKGRADHLVRLMEIVVRARTKFPLKSEGSETQAQDSNPLVSVGFRSVLTNEITLEWVWEDYLQEAGYLLLTGHAGVGKTQFSLDATAQMALGNSFLGKNVKGQHKIGFFSLEMGLADLKYFLSQQAMAYSKEEQDILEENLRFFALGEPLYLNRKEEKRRVEEVIRREGLTGVIFDSLGSTTEEELTGEKDVKNLFDWNDHIRQEYNVFTWYIHHHRKATGDNKKPKKLADVYGSQYITARATTVMCLWDEGAFDAIEVSCLKLRLAPKFEPFNAYRGMDLRFVLSKNQPKKAAAKPESSSPPVATKKSDDKFNLQPPGKGLSGI